VKICLVNLDFIPHRSSGLAVYGETLALGLAQAGHQVTVVAAQRAGLASHEQINDITVYRVPIGRGDWIGYAWNASPLVARLQRQYRFDVVHFLDVHFAYRYRGPFVASLFQSFRQRATSDGGLPYHSNRRGLLVRLVYYHAARWLAERPAVGRARHLLAASQAAADEFITHYGVPAGGVSVVPLGIDLSRFHSIAGGDLRRQLSLESNPVLLYVGFCTPRKGLDYLAQAMPLLAANVRLVLIGRWEAHYRDKFYRALGPATERVIEVGYVPDQELPSYYALADLFVFPTLLEGFGLPLAEALACGTPVVTTDAGSSPEVVGPGGLIVPARDPAALARAINTLLADADLRQRLGRAGREWVLSRFNQQRMIEANLSVYERVVATTASL
jgi:glycosyltransferase involved in cell wall biosynthesis